LIPLFRCRSRFPLFHKAQLFSQIDGSQLAQQLASPLFDLALIQDETP
jgi:hypothetical protein